MLDAQSLWDATMAHSISSHLSTASSDRRVLHLCGRFHCEHGLGIPEHLSATAKQGMRLVVCLSSEEAFGDDAMGDEEIASQDFLKGIADFVVLTEPDFKGALGASHE